MQLLAISQERLRQLCRYDQPTLAQLRKVERWAKRMPGLNDEWRAEQHAAVDAEHERRAAEISGGITRLALLIVARQKAIAQKEREKAIAKAVRAARRREERRTKKSS